MIQIRHAIESDLDRLTEINNHYILNSNATFDIEPQSAEQRKVWFEKYKTSGPYQLLVAEKEGVVVGCAYSSRYRDHFSFDQTVETSIYLAHDCRSKGVGSLLYAELFERLKNESLHLAVVGIALPNEASIALHRKFGFEEVGIFNGYATKHEQKISSIWMQKKLNLQEQDVERPVKLPQTYFAVIFSSQRNSVEADEYEHMANRMLELAKDQDGFIGVESSRGVDGYGITISYWKTEDSIMKWKSHGEHLIAQKLGKSKWYKSFKTRICKVEREYEFRGRNDES